MAEIRSPDFSKYAKNPKKDNDLTIFWNDVIVNFFDVFFVCFVKFIHWSKFHISIITGSGIMTIYFYKGLTRNPEIENTPVWVLRNIWRLEQIMDAKFGPNISNRMLLNASKFQGYSFYRFWVIKGEPTGGGGGIKLLPPTPPIGEHTVRLLPPSLLSHLMNICIVFKFVKNIFQKLTSAKVLLSISFLAASGSLILVNCKKYIFWILQIL